MFFIRNFFGTMRLFLKFFRFERVSPPFVSIFCNTVDVKKSQRVLRFTYCGSVKLFKNLILNFFRKFFKISQGSPVTFFHILQPSGVSQSPPFTTLSLRHSAASFGCSRVVFVLNLSQECCVILAGLGGMLGSSALLFVGFQFLSGRKSQLICGIALPLMFLFYFTGPCFLLELLKREQLTYMHKVRQILIANRYKNLIFSRRFY